MTLESLVTIWQRQGTNMTSREIQQLRLPEEDCDIDDCPQYCRQWSSERCQLSEENGKACGLCKDDTGFMQSNSCYDCVTKKGADNHDHSWAKNTKQKKHK